MSRLALVAVAGLAVLFAACSGGGDGPKPRELHDRIVGALRTEQVSHLRYTFQEFPEAAVERHELWIDWQSEHARHERTFPDLSRSVTVVADGLVHGPYQAPQPIGESGFEQSFEDAAIPTTHLFQWLTLPEEQFREPLRRFEVAEDRVERFGWTIEFQGDDSGFCGEITLELDAQSSQPLRSYADPCPERGDVGGRGFVTEYELIEELPRSALPLGAFDPSAATDGSGEPVPAATPTPAAIPARIEDEARVEGFELLVTSVPFDDRFPTHRAPDRLDRVFRDADGRVRVEVLLTAEERGVPAFRLGFESVVASPSGQEIVVAVCERGDCGSFGPPGDDALTVLHRSTDGGQTWSRYAEFEGGAWLVGWSDGEVVIREPTLADGSRNAPERAVRRFPSGEPVMPPDGASSQYGAPSIDAATGKPRWRSSNERSFLDETGRRVLELPVPGAVSLVSAAASRAGGGTLWTWRDAGETEPVYAALFAEDGSRVSPVWSVPYGCCFLAVGEDEFLVPRVPLTAALGEAYADQLPEMSDGRPYSRRPVPALLDPQQGTVALLTDPFAHAPYQDRDEIRVVAVVLPATREAEPSGQRWREVLTAEPELVELVERVLAGPESVVALTARVQALCSFHGDLFAHCENQGLGVSDRFEAIVVSDLLFCEACEVPAERPQTALVEIFERGGVPAEAFWGGIDRPTGGDLTAGGVELVAVWTLDARTANHIGERWPELSARYALAFRAARPSADDDVATGFLLFVDPSADHPVAIIEPVGESWTAFDTARELGPWRELYAKQ